MSRWSSEKIFEWYFEQEWLIGSNFLPSTAINQLEMFQRETFDEKTIEKELGLANSLGFNSMRVYLHDLLWDIKDEFLINFEKCFMLKYITTTRYIMWIFIQIIYTEQYYLKILKKWNN